MFYVQVPGCDGPMTGRHPWLLWAWEGSAGQHGHSALFLITCRLVSSDTRSWKRTGLNSWVAISQHRFVWSCRVSGCLQPHSSPLGSEESHLPLGALLENTNFLMKATLQLTGYQPVFSGPSCFSGQPRGLTVLVPCCSWFSFEQTSAHLEE